jgi:hypothetical protein
VTSISSFLGALYARAVDAKRHKIQLRTFIMALKDVALMRRGHAETRKIEMIPIMIMEANGGLFS